MATAVTSRTVVVDAASEERWLPILGYEGLYEVSDLGRVRSHIRRTNWLLKPRRSRDRNHRNPGWTVALFKDGVRKNHLIHRLVLEAFVGPCPEGQEACHWNDDAADNRLANLRWDTHSANTQDKLRNGNHEPSNRTHCPRGHLLAAPNLAWNGMPRNCRACRNAQARTRRRGLPFNPEEADRNYRKIMEGAY